jgi:hypothetical protein
MNKLDLHHTYHSEVPKKLDKFISEHYNDRSLKIITGNSEIMKRIVIDLIVEYGYDYEIGDYLGLNSGYIKIF